MAEHAQRVAESRPMDKLDRWLDNLLLPEPAVPRESEAANKASELRNQAKTRKGNGEALGGLRRLWNTLRGNKRQQPEGQPQPPQPQLQVV